MKEVKAEIEFCRDHCHRYHDHSLTDNIIIVIENHHFQVGLRVSEEQGAEQENTITGFHWPIHTVSHHRRQQHHHHQC